MPAEYSGEAAEHAGMPVEHPGEAAGQEWPPAEQDGEPTEEGFAFDDAAGAA